MNLLKNKSLWVTTLLATVVSAAVQLVLSWSLSTSYDYDGGDKDHLKVNNGVVRGMVVQNGMVRFVNPGLVQQTDVAPTGVTAGTLGDALHTPLVTTNAAGQIIGFTNSPQQIRDQGGQVFNVMADRYGCVGDGVHDDAPGIQLAFNDAVAVNGQVFFPPPPSTYRINSGITITPVSSQSTVSARSPPIQKNHTGGLITYYGPSNAAVITLLGITDWCFENIGVTVNSGLTGVTVWNQTFTTQFPNSGLSKFIKCNTIFDTTNLYCRGFLLGQATGGNASNGFSIKFFDCTVQSHAAPGGCIGIQIGGSQNYSSNFYDCNFTNDCNVLCGPVASTLTASVNNGNTTVAINDCLLFPPTGNVSIGGQTAAYTSKSATTGPGNLTLSAPWAGGTFSASVVVSLLEPLQPGTTAVYPGNVSFLWQGGQLAGGSTMGYDIVCNTSGYFHVDTMQCQNGVACPRRILQVGQGSFSAPLTAKFENVTWKNYTAPTDGNGMFWTHTNTLLELDKCNIGVQSSRTVTDGVTNNTTTLTSATANFTSGDVGALLTGTGIPVGTTIASVTNATTVVMSQAATTSASGVSVTISQSFRNANNQSLVSNLNGSAYGSVKLKDCILGATFPFVVNNASGVGWPVKYNHVQLVNNTGVPISALNNDPNLWRTITAATYAVTTGNDHNVLCNCTSNAIVPTLPACASVPAGWTYVLKKIDSSANAATITPFGTNTIDGAANFPLTSQNKYIKVVNDGVSNWANVGSN